MATTTTILAAPATTSFATEKPSPSTVISLHTISSAPKNLSFLNLPPELRTKIYHHALESTGSQLTRLNDFPLHKGQACNALDCIYARYKPRREHVCVACTRKLKHRLARQTAEPALLHVDRTIRAEATAVWLYYVRWFVDTGFYVDFGSKRATAMVLKWLEKMGGQRRAMVKGLWVRAFDEGEARELVKRFVNKTVESQVVLERCKAMQESMRLEGEVFKVSFKAV